MRRGVAKVELAKPWHWIFVSAFAWLPVAHVLLGLVEARDVTFVLLLGGPFVLAIGITILVRATFKLRWVLVSLNGIALFINAFYVIIAAGYAALLWLHGNRVLDH